MEGADATSRRTALWTLSLVLGAFALYLLWSHYVKAYSDPVHYLQGARRLAEGEFPGRKPPLYYLFLLVNLEILGPVTIFLVNGPLLVLMAWLVYRVTLQLCLSGDGGAGGKGPDLHLAGMAALLILLATNLTFYVYLLNPYREPLAYCLLLAGVSLLLSRAARGGLGRAAAGAFLTGLSVGVRETCIVMMVPVTLYFLHTVFADREGARLKTTAVFFAFLLAGLAPYFLYNHLYSGHAAVPSYAATKWLAETADNTLLPRDIPIPGMSLRFFSTTGPEVLRLHWAKYGWWGLLLLAAGLAASWKRSMRAVWWLFLPSVVINMAFFSFWHRRMWRFYTIVDLFLVPVLALGFAYLLSLIFTSIPRHRFPGRRRLASPAAALLAAAAVAFLAVGSWGRDGAFKVWHVEGVRRHILPHLERPFTFVGNDDVNEMLRWILDADGGYGGYGVGRRRVREAGLDQALRREGKRSLEAAERVNIYVYKKKNYPLLEEWFDLEEVLSLEGTPVPFTREGGKRIEGTIHRARPWEERSFVVSLPPPAGGGPGLLKVDARRLWDYRERTFCRLFVDGTLLEERVPDGLHFLPLPASTAAGTVEVGIRSDAPLPARIMAEVFPLNAEMIIPFGLRGGGGWYYSYASPELLEAAPLHRRAFYLRERGSLVLPKFCDSSHEMMAEFTVESTTWRPGVGEVRELTADAGHGAARMPLAPRGVTTRFAVSLGPGSGGLELVNVDLSFTSTHRSRRSYARISGVRLFPVPRSQRERVALDVGSHEDLPYILGGFHPPGKHGGTVTVRWTDGRGALRLPLGDGGDGRFTVGTVESSQPGPGEVPSFAVNGLPIPEESVGIDAGEGLRTYSFTVPRRHLKGEGGEILEIISPPWVPLERGLGADNRSLGIMVDTVEAESL